MNSSSSLNSTTASSPDFFANPSKSTEVSVVTSISKSYTINSMIYLTIGFIYAVLLSLIIDKVIHADKYDAYCSWNSRANLTEAEQTERSVKCNEMEKNNSKQKFVYMIALGIISMISGAHIAQSYPAYSTSGVGIAFGGAMTTIWYVIIEWSSFSDSYKILILAAALAVLVYGSSKLMIPM